LKCARASASALAEGAASRAGGAAPALPPTSTAAMTHLVRDLR
jgi:hypothetical protein